MRTALSLIVSFAGMAAGCAGAFAADGQPLSGAWRFSNGAEFPGAEGSMEALPSGGRGLHFDFSKGGNYVGLYLDLDPPAPLKAVSFRLNKPADGTLTLRATDATGQDFQKQLDVAASGWQDLTVMLDDWTASWGGAKDGVFHPPFRTLGFLMESQGLASPKGAMQLESLAGYAGESGNHGKSVLFEGRYVVTDFRSGMDFSVHPAGALENGILKTAAAGASPSAGLSGSVSLFGRPKTLELRVKRGTPGAVLRMTLGSHFQNFDRVLGTLEGGPQTLSTAMPPDDWVHSGAAEEEIAHPIRVCGITLESGKPDTPAEVEFDALECATTVPRSNAVTLFSKLDYDKAALSGHADVPMTAVCRAWNMLEAELRGTVRMTLRDWDNRVLDEKSSGWVLPANGAPVDLSWQVTVPAKRSFADVEFCFEAEGVKPASARSGFTRGLTDAGDAALRPESPWGMGVYLYRYGMGNPEMDRAAAMAQAAGVKWTREEFSWASIETAPGQYDFSYYDTIVDTANRHGISVYGLLSYWGRFTQPYTEKGIDDFCLWARATVRHFKGRVRHWEIYNEPNIFFWDGPKELYPVLVKRCGQAIKEEDPQAVVLAVSTSGIDRKFIKLVLDAGAPFDILTIHPYRGRLNDAGFVRELRDAAALVDNRPVWITEMGWPTHIGGGVDERAQAQLLSRCYMGAVASGAIQNMGWYDFRDDGGDPFYNEANFGVLRQDMTPKPAYRALASVCRAFTGGKPSMPNIEGEGVLGLQMGDALALWSPAADRRVSVWFKVPPKSVSNLMGEPVDVQRKLNRITVQLPAGSPVFFARAVAGLVRAEPGTGKKPEK